jgi:hypothetical protein
VYWGKFKSVTTESTEKHREKPQRDAVVAFVVPLSILPVWNPVFSVVDFLDCGRTAKNNAVRASHPNRMLPHEFHVYPLTPQRAT